jgi:SIR2-like domain
MLLGSGSSVLAGMPTVVQITQRILTGNNVMWMGSGWRAVDQLPPNHEILIQELPGNVAFVSELKQLCDEYFAAQDKNRKTNYEDIAYVARQIEDGLSSEYENPALLPLIERLQAGRDDLGLIAAAAANYIDDIVGSLLGRPAGPFDHLTAIADAVRDGDVADMTIATLNHDVVLERAFDLFGVDVSDGFADAFGTLRVWNARFSIPTRKLLKLHGSLDWWRYRLTLDGWTGQFTARAVDGDPEHASGPNGERLDYPALGRPLVLTGTFNKILSYPTGIYADQHFRFHEALAAADALVVIGYGFRDKAINARIVAWAERPGERRMVVVHPDQDRLGQGARGAIRDKWLRWQNAGLLRFLPEYLNAQTSWAAIRGLLI